MNTKLRQKVKKRSERDIFKLMKKVFFRKTMENVGKHKILNL